jgi:hypothetical protein
MAAQETGRNCCGVELDPLYVDVTVRRWQNVRAARTVTCSGLLYVTVGDTIAQKQVDFKVERTTDGKMSVSVDPFLF